MLVLVNQHKRAFPFADKDSKMGKNQIQYFQKKNSEMVKLHQLNPTLNRKQKRKFANSLQ